MAIRDSTAPLAPAHDLLGQLGQIRLRIDRRQLAVADHIAQADQALETLPLAADEFALARQRLRNTAGYVDQTEWGAASYEVNLLLRWLTAFIKRLCAA